MRRGKKRVDDAGGVSSVFDCAVHLIWNLFARDAVVFRGNEEEFLVYFIFINLFRGGLLERKVCKENVEYEAYIGDVAQPRGR